jgi:hypothetical protein
MSSVSSFPHTADGQARTLSQLARLLFDAAALKWQLSLGLQFIAGVVAVAVSVLSPPIQVSVIASIVVLALMVAAYWQRFAFEFTYDAAELMRRQSVLSEGLGWPISPSQFDEWKVQAGRRLLSTARQEPRSIDYYETKAEPGDLRLAEMTRTSLFWTRHLYRKLKAINAVTLCVIAVLLTGILLAAPLLSTGVYLAYAVCLAVPAIISIDLLGLLFRLNRAISALNHIDGQLDRLCQSEGTETGEVLRIVAEYNCAVAAGLPIPKWLYDAYSEEITELRKAV